LKLAWLFLLVPLCSCAHSTQQTEQITATAGTADGVPVSGAPAPELVQLEHAETVGETLHVTVGNSTGDYVLVCDLSANKDSGIQSCIVPHPSAPYMLFRGDTKWLMKGARDPMTIDFMQDFSVKYNNAENIGLAPARPLAGETFQMFWLLSWTPRGGAK
jgi:hypothetical protein